MLILFLLIITGSWNKRNPEVRSESTFQIYLGRKNVGYLNIIHTRGSEKSRIQVHSEVEARFIFKYTAFGRETYEYRNDTLMHSDVFRKVNNRISLQQTLIKHPEGYRYSDQKSNRILPIPVVRLNMTRLFVQEPSTEERVFSDRFTQWIPIKRLGKHQYQVELPNGSDNIFTYEKGKCTSVVSRGSFYTVRLLPQS
jgi:heme oxygenase